MDRGRRRETRRHARRASPARTCRASPAASCPAATVRYGRNHSWLRNGWLSAQILRRQNSGRPGLIRENSGAGGGVYGFIRGVRLWKASLRPINRPSQDLCFRFLLPIARCPLSRPSTPACLAVSIQWGRVPRNRRDAKGAERKARKKAPNILTV